MEANNLFEQLTYADVLGSDDGYDLVYAVGTTYSLDFPTLLTVPLMLGDIDCNEEDIERNPYATLHAIERSARKFAIFFNAGSFPVPGNLAKQIYSLLEQSLVQIELPAKGGGFVNFHPKIWVIRERSRQEPTSERLKVVVMSRNLTHRDNLEVVCQLTGQIRASKTRGAQHHKHQPLLDFLRWLKDQAKSRQIKNGIDLLCKGLECVREFETEKPFDDYDFYPMGIPDHNGTEECLQPQMLQHSAEMVIISPFIDLPTLKKFATANQSRKMLITRQSSLTPEILQLFPDNVYVMKEAPERDGEEPLALDLHEKVYYVRNRETYRQHLYLGSTNATQNGFGRNVEFLLRLQFAFYQIGYDTFTGNLIDGANSLFEPTTDVEETATSQEDEQNLAAQQTLRRAILGIRNASIKNTDDNPLYHITIHCAEFPSNSFKVKIAPLYLPEMAQTLSDGVTFEGVPLAKLSEFFILEVTPATEELPENWQKVKSVVKIYIRKLPCKERDEAVFQSIIDTPEKFVGYLASLFNTSTQSLYATLGGLAQSTYFGGSQPLAPITDTPLYERMLRAIYEDPELLKIMKDGLEKGKNVVSKEVLQMCETVQELATEIRKIKEQ